MDSDKLVANAGEAATFLALMGNEKRLLIMSHLMDAELSVGAIAEKVDLSQSALSQHLAKLRAQNLVQTRRDRQMIYYSSRSAAVRALLEMLDGVFGEAEEPRPALSLRHAST
jgi:DNA-binding transcriptional ArsR family regulator